MVLRLAQSRDLTHLQCEGTRRQLCSQLGSVEHSMTDGLQAGASISFCSCLWPPSSCATMSGELQGPGCCGQEKMAWRQKCGQEAGREHRREHRQEHRQARVPPELRLRFRPLLQLGLLSFLALLPAGLTAPPSPRSSRMIISRKTCLGSPTRNLVWGSDQHCWLKDRSWHGARVLLPLRLPRARR